MQDYGLSPDFYSIYGGEIVKELEGVERQRWKEHKYLRICAKVQTLLDRLTEGSENKGLSIHPPQCKAIYGVSSVSYKGYVRNCCYHVIVKV